MLADARLYLTQAWWTVAFPSLAISLVVLAVNFLGDAYGITSIQPSEADFDCRRVRRQYLCALMLRFHPD
jgi:hypothetical protein